MAPTIAMRMCLQPAPSRVQNTSRIQNDDEINPIWCVVAFQAIGVSNYCVSCLKCLLSKVHVKPVVNQIEFHVGMTADPGGRCPVSPSPLSTSPVLS